MKRKKKSPLKILQETLWQECRRITKNKYIKDGKYYCYTCDKSIEKANCQLGHFIPSSVGGALLKYNLDNLRLQCWYCNMDLGGNGSEFYPRLVKEIGQEKVDYLFILKRKSVKAFDYWTVLLEKYKKL